MRILWLYTYLESYCFDEWLHLDFAAYFNKIGVDLIMYGPNIHLKYPQYTPIPYNENTTMEELYKQLKFDVIILNTKSRMFTYYDPFNKIQRGCILPKDFNECKIPKIMIEEEEDSFHLM